MTLSWTDTALITLLEALQKVCGTQIRWIIRTEPMREHCRQGKLGRVYMGLLTCQTVHMHEQIKLVKENLRRKNVFIVHTSK